jgi:transcriptional regulator with XRE-family HTH domain
MPKNGKTRMRELTLGDIRKQHRVKQEVVAMALCVTASGVSKLESKRIQDVSLQRAAAYLAALGGSLKIEVTLPDGGIVKVGENISA